MPRPSRAKLIKERTRRLAARVRDNGVIMPSCSRCLRQKEVCCVSADSERCAHCILAGGNVQCDVWGPTPSEWVKLEKTEKELADDLRLAEEAQQRLMNHLFEAQAKVLRIRKQREMFRARASEMLRRGFKSLRDLEATEDKERLAEEGERLVTEQAQSEGEASALADPAALPDPPMDPDLAEALATYDPSNPFWIGAGFPGVADAGWADFDGGTSSTTQGS